MADGYNYDMQRLQQDAIRRAREMQSRAQSAAPSLNTPAPRPAPVQNRPAPPEVPPPARHTPPQEQHVPLNIPAPQPRVAPVREPKKGPLSPIGDIFDSLMADSERTLILVLIILLVEEKADTGVIFALMYLVL